MVPAWWLVVATTMGAPTLGPTGLGAAAASSGRPRECAARTKRGGSARPTVWQLAREPNLGRYCDLVALAQVQLTSKPEDARATAERADALLPGHAAPAVVVARAALAEGKLDEAGRSFDRARSIDARAVEDPPALQDLGRVLRRTGRAREALAVYRSLAPRVDLLGSADRATQVLLEAAHLAIADARVAETRALATAGLEEALAYLREARQRPPTRLAGDVLVSLALVLDRTGDRAQADAVLADARRGDVRLAEGVDYVTLEEDKLALEALVLEGTDRAAAARAWRRHLDGPGGQAPWVDASRRRFDETGRAKADASRSTGSSKKSDKGTKR